MKDKRADVVNVSKIKISKAIHNSNLIQKLSETDVVNVSKIKISKAIHNYNEHHQLHSLMLSMCQR